MKMSETDFFEENLCKSSKKAGENIFMKQTLSKQSRCAKCNAKFLHKDHANEEFCRPIENRWEVLSSSLNNVNAKQAWKNGTEKLSQTLNNVKNTFGVISQRIKNSTTKRQSLVNKEPPRSPITPYTRSRTVLGRTPTKLYSPFGIDTPTGKENNLNRSVGDENLVSSSTMVGKKLENRKIGFKRL